MQSARSRASGFTSRMSGRVFRRGATWSYVVDVGPDADGNRRQRKRGGFPTKPAAERALRELLNTLDVNAYVEPSRKSMADFLRDDWLAAMRPPRLRATTWTEYRRRVDDHIVPRIGGIPLQRLSAAQLNGLYADLLASGRKDGRGGLSPKSVREVHVIIRKALKDAVRWSLLERNVASLADPPSLHSASSARRRAMRTWTVAELHAFLDHVRDDRLHAVWMLAANTGMRRSELGGLRWADVQLDQARLAVRQRLASVNGVPELSEPTAPRSSSCG